MVNTSLAQKIEQYKKIDAGLAEKFEKANGLEAKLHLLEKQSRLLKIFNQLLIAELQFNNFSL